MPENDIADGTSNTILVGEGEPAGEAPPPLTETRPRDDQPVDETSPDNSRPDDGTTSPNWDEAPSSRRLERAEGDSDDAGPPPADDSPAPPDVPETGEVFDPNTEGVVGGATEPDGQQQFLVDTDGDGLLDTVVDGVPVGDGTFKVVESSPLDEPIPDPTDRGTEADIPEDDAEVEPFEPKDDGRGEGEPPRLIDDPPDNTGDGELEIIEPKESAVDPGGPPNVFRPGEASTEGEHGKDTDDIDLSGLYEDPPAFGSGAAGDDYAASTAESDEPSIPGDDHGLDVPEVPADDYELAPDDLPEDRVDLNDGAGGGDLGLLEQVAEAVGDLWDDAADVVT